MQPSDEIKQKLDIVDLIREYMPLQQAGMNFRACCPFHQEKSPSFMVSPDKQIYHCFGCGKGGDILSFVMEMEGVDFVEAMRILAPKAGVTLKRQSPEATSKRNRLLDVMDLSRRYFYKVFTEMDKAAFARDYLRGRGLREETIDEWQIGYSFDAWDNLCNFLKKKGFTDEEIFAAGMSSRSQQGNKYFDRFRGRIMFPINDVNGNPIAFSARVSPEREKEEKQGKYVNSPQTYLYDKSRVLFGLDKAKLAIKREDLAVVVEGQMDVIQAHQAGFKNVVASSGTALSADQITILKRYTQNIALAFDMDKAGEMAADRGIREAMRLDMNIKVVEIPDGKDPDDCIRHNPDLWVAALGTAKPVMRYYFDRVLKNVKRNNIEEVNKAVHYLLPFVAGFENIIKQDFWLRDLAERTGVSEENLKSELGKTKGVVAPSKPIATISAEKPAQVSKEHFLSEILLALVIKFPFLLEYLESHFDAEYLVGDRNRDVYKSLMIYYNSIIFKESGGGAVFNFHDFCDWLVRGENSEKADNCSNFLGRLGILGDSEFAEVQADSAKIELFKIFKPLKRFSLINRIKSIQQDISDLERAGDSVSINQKMSEFNELSLELRKLEND